MRLLLIIVLLPLCGSAQLFNCYTSEVIINTGGIVSVNGSIMFDDSTIVEQNGLLHIDSSVMILDTSLFRGDGLTEVGQDWENSATFLPSSGNKVLMFGGDQFITGDSISYFYDLELTGSGIKHLEINAHTTNELNLNDRELATDQDSMFHDNPISTSLLFDNSPLSEGFISNLDSGAIVRATNSTDNYIFPTGSSVNIRRFRKIELEPEATNNAQYVVSFYNYDPNNDNYDRSLHDSITCVVNPEWYHRVGWYNSNLAASMLVYYDDTTDGEWSSIGRWYSNQWNNIQAEQTGVQVYNYVRKDFHNSFQNLPVALLKHAPGITPGIDTSVCAPLSQQLVLNVQSDGDSIFWTSSQPPFTGQWTNQIEPDIQDSGSYIFTAYALGNYGCNSDTVIFNVTGFPSPIAGLTTSATFYYPGKIIQFIDSSNGAISWNYDFNDGSGRTDTARNPLYIFESPGQYNVLQEVTNQYGCLDTALILIVISDSTIIPNVFTPNGDNVNDKFEIITGLTQYSVTILNRWGVILYQGDENSTFWDGRTRAGREVPEGTYYVIVTSEEQNISYPQGFKYNGSITLLRK